MATITLSIQRQNDHDHRYKHITYISTSTKCNIRRTSKLCKGAKGIVACLSPERCETPSVLDTDTPCKNRTRKTRRKIGSNHFDLTRKNSANKNGIRPMPT